MIGPFNCMLTCTRTLCNRDKTSLLCPLPTHSNLYYFCQPKSIWSPLDTANEGHNIGTDWLS